MSVKSWYNKRYTPEQIKEIQRTLGVEADGLIGPNTLRAIKEYQADAGLKADGLWGKSTQAKADEWNAQYDSIQPTFSKGKDTDNLKEAAYKQYSDNLEKKYYQDEQKKYESNFLPNYEEDNQELALLNAHIDSLKKQIAERDARKQEAMNAQPKTRVGWASYIIDNDRGLLDKYADAERAWQVARQQNEYSQQLADKQRAEQAAYNRDEWQLNLSKAQNEYTAASTALAIAKKNGNKADINTAEQAVANAKASVDYWKKRLGLPTVVKKNDDNPPEGKQEYTPEGKQPLVSVESILATAKAKFNKNLTKKEIDEQMTLLKPYIDQKGEASTLYEDYRTKKSKEDKDFDAAVLKEAIVLADGQDSWDAIDEAMKEKLKAEARAKLGKGVK